MPLRAGVLKILIMKTSVKILLGLVLAIFLVPTIFFMAFSYKASHGNFKPYDEASNWSRVDIGPSRFIKISAPDKEVMECSLMPSDKPHYMKWAHGQGGDDSISISQQADTLFINYISLGDNNTWRRSVEIFVADWQQLDINGATVKLDSVFGGQYASKQIDLTNGHLNLGKAKRRGNTEEEPATHPIMVADSASSLQLNATNSQLYINKGYPIGKLGLQLAGTTLNIAADAAIHTANGSISADSQLNMTGLFLAKLAGLVVK